MVVHPRHRSSRQGDCRDVIHPGEERLDLEGVSRRSVSTLNSQRIGARWYQPDCPSKGEEGLLYTTTASGRDSTIAWTGKLLPDPVPACIMTS